ncbi:hypothetical protein MSAR_32330 [Mycolicibacterium sarraceniae]|uniref:Uncharacterized protein n=1 Tax=Mycolicibacterium sarraceniae TaxID=1534348 RepID=A0A7I7SSW8_9MYCO|nr:hypothetical protein MSAR_32330 [Mycolicibacterium sarraceniae]
MRGSATITIVPSSVDINCMPVIATIASPSTREASGLVAGSGPLAPDMGSNPTALDWARFRA